MSRKTFAIMGATGHVGHVIVEDLLKRGHTVQAIGRDQKKLQLLVNKGAESCRMDSDDVDGLTDAFSDTYAVFSMLPSVLGSSTAFLESVSQAICQAVVKADVNRIVNLSSIGAHLAEGTGPIKTLHQHEKRLDGLKAFTTLVHLRPDFFMENLNGFLPMIQKQGVMASCIDANLPIPMVATRDIGWKAADFLDSSAPQPHLAFEFFGPKEVTMHQVADLFQQAYHLPDLRYTQISYDDDRQQMIKAGFKAENADLMVEMHKAFNSGLIQATQELKPSHQGRTTLEEYVQMLTHKNLVHV